MTTHEVGTREQWRAAYERQLANEKELTRRATELARDRQQLPWVPVDKEYVFDTTAGQRTLADLFDGRSQLIVRHFMHGPNTPEGCPRVHVRNGQLGRRGAAPGPPGRDVPACVTLAAAGPHRVQGADGLGRGMGVVRRQRLRRRLLRVHARPYAEPRLRVRQRQHARRDGADGAELLRAAGRRSSSTPIRPTIAAPRH